MTTFKTITGVTPGLRSAARVEDAIMALSADRYVIVSAEEALVVDPLLVDETRDAGTVLRLVQIEASSLAYELWHAFWTLVASALTLALLAGGLVALALTGAGALQTTVVCVTTIAAALGAYGAERAHRKLSREWDTRPRVTRQVVAKTSLVEDAPDYDERCANVGLNLTDEQFARLRRVSEQATRIDAMAHQFSSAAEMGVILPGDRYRRGAIAEELQRIATTEERVS